VTLLLYKNTLLLLQPVALASQAVLLLMMHHLAFRLRSLYLQWQKRKTVTLCKQFGIPTPDPATGVQQMAGCCTHHTSHQVQPSGRTSRLTMHQSPSGTSSAAAAA
jgi:hypothetical protein